MGLTDRYNFDLKWSPDDGSATVTNEEGKPDTAPSIFTAVQEQLGLRLDASKGPVKFIVIDHVGSRGRTERQFINCCIGQICQSND
jgi:uncharacterized protein (TIGR03435 family)